MKLVKDHPHGPAIHGAGSGSSVLADTMAQGDHRVPDGAIVYDPPKICQGCGFDFLRVRGSSDKYCRRCHASPFLVPPPPKPFLIH